MRRTTFLISALLLLILANVLMISYASPAFLARGEGFVGFMDKFTDASGNEKFKDGSGNEGFTSYSGSPGGAKNAYEAIGPFDGVRLQTGNSSSWRYTKPDEPLLGAYPKFNLGPDNLFIFRDNQSKPECCGASFSSSTGCVCTTPEQRKFINERGGNRTAPDSDPGV
jgi:hypothetical protein